jgi:hypothetical protein
LGCLSPSSAPLWSHGGCLAGPPLLVPNLPRLTCRLYSCNRVLRKLFPSDISQQRRIGSELNLQLHVLQEETSKVWIPRSQI